MEIAACFDHNFVMPTGVMIYSVCANNRDAEINFHLLVNENVTAQDRKDLMGTIAGFNNKKLLFYPIKDTIIGKVPLSKQWSTAIYYRFFLAVFLPHTIDKVLFLDSDIIVRNSLDSLWNTNIEDYSLAAVFDSALDANSETYNRLHYSSKAGYFNSGVMLINLDYWRKIDAVKTFFEYVDSHYEALDYFDQDVLNAVFYQQKLLLSPKYNFQNAFMFSTPKYDCEKYGEEVTSAMNDPVIVHFTDSKPWYKYDRDPNPYNSTFYKYQDQTQWRGKKIENRPLKLRLINFIADTLRHLKLKTSLKSVYLNIPPVD